MKTRKAQAELTKITNINELEQKYISLLNASERAVATAYAPNSNFSVGAAVLMDDGHLVIGSNQENMAYPSGLCAERVAVFAASAQYPAHIIKAVAICCDASAYNAKEEAVFTPCGACRQVLFEYEWKQKEDIKLFFKVRYRDEAWQAESVQALLPFPFILPEK
ncbi:MAG: cytidine deaminase [Bacteroidia bacterium]